MSTVRILQFIVVSVLSIFTDIASSTTFTFVNKCGYTVWPGILSGAGSSNLGSTGFELPEGSSKSFQAPTGWSGRFWGRTGCTQDPTTNHWSCLTGDCGSGQLECNGAGATPPATLAEFTLTGTSGATQDYYDVSLVDGYNLPLIVEATASGGGGGSIAGNKAGGACGSTGCVTDLNTKCPAELRVDGGGACRSACEAFGKDEYCCSGAYASPSTCKPSVYSQVFKSACPRSYSYAYDDASSTFTCPGGADYTVTFCPSSPSQKATMGQPTGGATGDGSGSQPAGTAVLADGSWLGDLASGGDSIISRNPISGLLLFTMLWISISSTLMNMIPSW